MNYEHMYDCNHNVVAVYDCGSVVKIVGDAIQCANEDVNYNDNKYNICSFIYYKWQ